uniref:3-hydroxyisobutyryl-CoA hydrolase n=1 Tax=Photinus pyralis TaxID=7054 RepID=A0A1Y1NIA4_PHOPY
MAFYNTKSVSRLAWGTQKLLFKRFSLAAQPRENIVINHLESKDAGILILNLNKQERKNALSIQMLADLNRAIDNVKKQIVRVLIIKSNVPGTFCAGADLKERLTLTSKELSQYNIQIRSTMSRIYDLPIPVLAAIDGHALGECFAARVSRCL